MWFPKSAWQWPLVVGAPFVLFLVIFGPGAAFIITAVLVGGYCAVYGLKTQKKPEDQKAVIADTTVTIQRDGQTPGQEITVLPPKPQAVVVAPPKPKSDFAVPNYDVPHVTFNRTPDGFTVYFKKAKISTHRVLSKSSNPKGATDATAALLAMGIAGAIHLGQAGTNIEVNREAVIIDGKKMSRRDFGGFHISKTWQGAHIENSLGNLCVSF